MTRTFEQLEHAVAGDGSRRKVLRTLAAAATLPLLPSLARAQSGKSVMRVAHVLTEHDNVHRAVVKFKEAVEKGTKGQVEVQIYPNSALGSLRVTFESMQLGNLEAGVWDAATPANVTPQLMVPELPYIFRDLNHVHQVMDGPIGQEMTKALLDKAKVRTLAVYDTTFRKIFTKPRPINVLADMKGLKLRVPEAQAYIRCMQLLGANPTPIAWGELYTSLETGVVQGFENKCEAAYNAKLHEQTKFAAYTGHIFVLNPLMISERWLGAQSKDTQQAILDAARESMAWQRAEAPASEKAFEQKMRASGVTFTSPDPAPFRQAVEPFYKEYGDKINAAALIKKVRES
ncbi:MAG: TRAP transporter substrate-binding protein [Burkholderiales bacterium]|nr:TRAP transporter substrate-binding protein [Burkholderiales bacterium]